MPDQTPGRELERSFTSYPIELDAEKLFVAYDPHLTFSRSDAKRFLNRSGRSIEIAGRDLDLEALFRLAQLAYSIVRAAFPICESFDFEKANRIYIDYLQHQLLLFRESVSKGSIKLYAGSGVKVSKEAIDNYLSYLSDNALLFWLREEFRDELAANPPELRRVVSFVHALSALRTIDHVLASLNEAKPQFVSEVLEVVQQISYAQEFSEHRELGAVAALRRTLGSEWGRMARVAALKVDPKQSEKQLAKECWREWQRMPTRYRSKAAFARDMLTKFEHLESQKVIEDWCRDWEKSEADA